MSAFDNVSSNGLVSRQTLHAATNFDRLKNNKVADKYNERFKNVYSGNGIYMNKEIYKNREGMSEDVRLESDDVAYFSIMTGFDMLKKRMGERNRRNIYKYQTLNARRQQMINLTTVDEIDEVLTKLCDETIIVKPDNKKFAECKINELELEALGVSEAVIKKIAESVARSEASVYAKLGLRYQDAWKKFYRFASEGKLAWEIVYDNPETPSLIVGFQPIDAYALSETYNKGIRLWVYEEHDPRTGQQRNRIYYDHQVMFIAWSDIFPNGRISYLEQVMKAYNMLRIITESKVVWAVNAATFRTLITIPTKGQARKRAAQSLTEEKMRYKDDIFFDYDSGQIQINGEPNIPFTKEVMLAAGDNGEPTYSTVDNNSPDLYRLEQDEYFTKRFYRSSRIPMSRFDEDKNETWNFDPAQTYRTEMSFGTFIERIRTVYGNILLRPVTMQLILDIPELADDAEILDCIYLEWTSYSLFKEMMEFDIEEKRLAHIAAMKDAFTEKDENGDEEAFFPVRYLLKKYFKMEESDLEQIDEARMDDIKHKAIRAKRKKDLLESLGLSESPIQDVVLGGLDSSYDSGYEVLGGETEPPTVDDTENSVKNIEKEIKTEE